jgi:hypothetical protein
MAGIGRRGLVKDGTPGALALSVGGVEVLMMPNQTRPRNVPFRLLGGHQGARGFRSNLGAENAGSGIARSIDQQLGQ